MQPGTTSSALVSDPAPSFDDSYRVHALQESQPTTVTSPSALGVSRDETPNPPDTQARISRAVAELQVEQVQILGPSDPQVRPLLYSITCRLC